VDSSDHAKLPAAKTELHSLLTNKPLLDGIPLLVLGNKNDLPGSLDVDGIIEALGLKSLSGREVCCYSVSAKECVNMDVTLQWLTKHAK
jgi:ADP-ribosylation factor-like protein 8